MPRFFFHVQNGKTWHDFEGTELPSLDRARLEAVRFAGDLLRERAADFWEGGAWSMNVIDAAGASVFQLSFYATATPSPPDPGESDGTPVDARSRPAADRGSAPPPRRRRVSGQGSPAG